MAWKRSNGDSGKYFCNATTISDHVSVPGRGNLKCQSGCYGKLGDMQVYCSMFNEAEDWMIGHRSYIATMRNTVTKFEARLVTQCYNHAKQSFNFKISLLKF